MATLEKRNGTWYSRVMINGKRVHRALDKDKRIAQQMLLEILKGQNAGRFGHVASELSWSAFKEKYLEWSEGAKAKYTRAHDKRAIAHLEGFRRITAAADITPQLLEDLRLQLKRKGKNAPVINRELQSLKSIMRWGEARGLVERGRDWSVCGKFPTPRNRVDFYSPEELGRLLKNCDRENDRTLALLCGRAGLRCSEAYYARWQDLDLKRGIITVQPREGWTPKTRGSTRHVPLAKDLRAQLEAVKRRSASEYLVAEPGTGWRPSCANSMAAEFSKNVIRGARLRGRLHILRHTFASHLAQAGVALYTISKLLGHSSIRQTECYAHLCPDSLGSAIELLPELPAK